MYISERKEYGENNNFNLQRMDLCVCACVGEIKEWETKNN